MVEVKNQFASHLIFWLFALPFVAVLVLPALLSARDFEITEAEVAFFQNVLDLNTGTVTATCDRIFNSLFVETHIASAFRDFFVPHTAPAIKEVKVSLLSSGAARNYNDALWLMVYRGMWRITGLWPTILSVLFALGIPCLMDGLAVRARKSYNFQFHNPVFFWSASHAMILVLGLGFVLPFMPYALNPSILGLFCVAFCAAIWVTAANFQTGT